MNLNIIISIVTFFTILIISVVVFLQNRSSKINKSFAILILAISLWIITNVLADLSKTINSAMFWSKLAIIWPLFLPILLLYVIIELYHKNDKKYKKILIPLSILSGIIILLAPSSLNIKEVSLSALGVDYIPGPLYYLLFFYLFIGFGISFYFLWHVYRSHKEPDSSQAKFILIGVFLTVLFSVITNILLPILDFGIASIFGPPTVLFFIGFTSYAILKHKLFNIKVIATELLTFAIWVAILFEFFTEDTLQGRLITGGLFVFTIIAGILLIRSVRREVEQKEIFQDLSNSLEIAKNQLEKKTTRLTALQSFTASITKTLDYEKMVQEIVDDIYHKLGYASALLLLISEDEKKIYPMTISQNPLSEIALKILSKPLKEYYGDFENDSTLAIKAAKTEVLQKGDFIADVSSPPVPKAICKAMQIATRVKSVVALPVATDEKTIGVLNIFLLKPKEEIDNDELELMQTLADQVGIVMKNAGLYKQLKETNEKLVETDKLKAGMFSFVSHQIKAPISIVKGFSQLIYDGKYGKIPKKVKETVGLVKESADRLIHLTEDFLDLRRIEEGRMDYKFVDLDIVAMAKSIIAELQFLANQKKLELSLETSADEIKIKADEQRMRQVIQNLIENSIKYTEKGFVKVEIKKEENGGVLVKVFDSGMGIAPNVLPELFDQFKRAQAARTIKGTGLGLYIAKQIVEAHKGKIWAESDGEGRGSRFYVKLGNDNG